MPEIGTYPLFNNLVDADSFLGVSSVNGKTHRASIEQLSQKLVTSNIAEQADLSVQNSPRLMTVQRTRQLLTDIYCLPRRVITDNIYGPTSSVTTFIDGHATGTNDLWLLYRNVRFDYATVAAATIQLDISYDYVTYPTNNNAYQATVTVANAMTHGGGTNSPVVLLPSISIGNPVVLNMVVRVTGNSDTSAIRMYEWRGSVRYFNSTTRVGPFWGSYTTTGNEADPKRMRLSSTGGQMILGGTVTGYLSPRFF